MLKKKIVSLLASAAFAGGLVGCQPDIDMGQSGEQEDVQESSYVTSAETTAALSAEQENDYVFLGDKKYDRNTENLVISDTDMTGSDFENIVYLDDLKSLTLIFYSEKSESDFQLDLLRSLKKIKRLYISGYCSDLSFISGMESLESIDLSEVYNLKNFEKLGENNTVAELTISSGSIENIDGITALPNLEALTIDSVNNDEYINLECLANLKKMKKLCLKWLNISSVDFIDNLENLEELFIWSNNTDISDYEKIGSCHNLQQLHLLNVDMADLDFLKEVLNLTFLEIRWGQISDISALKELKNLYGLEIWGIEYDDILCEMDWLHELTIYETKLTDKQINKLKDSLSDCDIKYI